MLETIEPGVRSEDVEEPEGDGEIKDKHGKPGRKFSWRTMVVLLERSGLKTYSYKSAQKDGKSAQQMGQVGPENGKSGQKNDKSGQKVGHVDQT